MIAVTGSALVWVAAPFAVPFLNGLLPMRVAERSETETSGHQWNIHWSESLPMRVAERSETEHKVRKVIPDPDEKIVAEVSVIDLKPSAGAEHAAADATHQDFSDDPPALLGIFRVRGKERPDWGVVRTKTNLYDAEGRNLGEVPPALFIDFVEFRKSSRGTMALCKLQHKGDRHGPFLIKRTDLSLFTGDYTELSQRQLNNLKEYFKTSGALEERRSEIMLEIAQMNPHYRQYKSAYENYMKHIEMAGDITAQRDDADGLRRSRLDDQLRRMKNEETALKKTYDEIHSKYKAWKAENIDKLPDISSDPEILELRREMRRLAKLLPGMV